MEEWKITTKFTVARKRYTKNFFDELNSDERLQDPELSLKTHIFLAVVDTALAQLKSRFEGQRLVSATFSFLYPKCLRH